MKRRAWNSFCLFSLLVFVLSIPMWARSYFVADSINRKTWGGGREVFYNIGVSRGAVMFYRYFENDRQLTSAGGWGWSYTHFPPAPLMPVLGTPVGRVDLHFVGFQLYYTSRTTGHGWTSVLALALPFWFVLPCAIPPIIWWRRRRGGGRGFPVDVMEKNVKTKSSADCADFTD